MQFYLSDISGHAVINKSGEKIGTVADLVATHIDSPNPRVVGLIMMRGHKKKLVFIPDHDIQKITSDKVNLSTDLVDLSPFEQRENEVLLARDVYDKQIVDIDDRRLTRVNDLVIEKESGKYFRLKGVDISMAGIFRRLKLKVLSSKFLSSTIIKWEDVQFLGGHSPMKFKLQYKNLESMHPADIARIIFEGPGYKHGSKVIAQLRDPIAADIIEELSPKLQKNLVESMKIEDVADVVEHMDPDKAADLLLTLGSDMAQKILLKIDQDKAKKIESLLNYPEHTTGAYMTTDYLVATREETVDQVFKRIKDQKQLPDFSFYIYVLDNTLSNKLVGVVSVYELFKADWRSRIDSIMIKRLYITHASDSIKHTLNKMYKYDLSALPVVSRNEKKLIGIVTFRDAISYYLPKSWKVRVRQAFNNSH